MSTLKDVAKASGVSLTQVSRALNDYDDVSEETKEKVKKVAQKIGYVKNINASRLAMQKSNQISVILCGFTQVRHNEDNILLSMLNGIYEFAEEINYEVLPLLVSANWQKSYINYCKSRMIPGVIFIGGSSNDCDLKELLESDYPCVTIDMHVEGINKACVLVDEEKYSQVAINEMINRGYKRIGMINGHPYACVSVRRQQGYENALLQNGLPFEKSLVLNGQFLRKPAAKETEKLLDLEVDGIFCASDIMAIGALETIQKKRLKVPDDIGLFGYDGLLLTKFTTPNISTIAQDNHQKGYEAAKLLHKILKGKPFDKQKYVECKLWITDSIRI